MHGISRKPPTDEDQAASSLKAAKLRDLHAQMLNFHRNKIYTKEAMEISASMLELNPEHYTGWNYRKLAVQFHLNQLPGNGDDSQSIQSILTQELRVVENALRRNHKSYGAWHHRKWVLSKGYLSTDRELRLLDMFCKLDSRNFHMWNYRRFIASLRKMPDEEELKYTTGIIEDNFSNYSAWHYRSVLLCKLMEKKVSGYDAEEIVLKDEYEFVRSALFTDPDDQSGWFYHLWLLEKTLQYEPALISSWPPQGSNLHLSHVACSTGPQPFPEVHFQSKGRMFPLILYFSEPVNCLSSSTVTAECECHTFTNLIWRALSASPQHFSQAWMTYIEFPDNIDLSKACSVSVTVAGAPEITSLSGKPLSKCCHLSFSVRTPSDSSVHSEVDGHHKISWSEENFMVHSEVFQSSFLHMLRSSIGVEKGDNKDTSDWRMDIISNEVAYCQELLLAMDCKIGKLTLVRLLMARSMLVSNGNMDDGTEVRYEDIVKLYDGLKKMDPVHVCYYEDQCSLALLKQVISDVESLAKHCGQYREPSSPASKPYSFLRLNGLLISRIGFMENFLWVQMLDLSHNKLRDIEGLEALQLLVCLKLSHNRIRSFTSLEPLKLLSSLKVLDISHNEIGAHSIDTRRHLCASPLTHSVENEWRLDELVDEDGTQKENWDAYLLFKDLKLVQLDIAGNPVANYRLRSFIVKLMPSLHWLDAEITIR